MHVTSSISHENFPGISLVTAVDSNNQEVAKGLAPTSDFKKKNKCSAASKKVIKQSDNVHLKIYCSLCW